MLPKKLRALIDQRGHLRGLEKLIARDYPKIAVEFERSKLKFGEFIYGRYYRKFQANCKNCGNPTRFQDFVKGYKTFCSADCGRAHPDTDQKKRERCMLRYGVNHPMKVKEITEKVKNTKLENWGTTALFLLPEIKEKARITCMRKFGAPSYAQSLDFQKVREEISAKAQKSREETMMERYGVTSPLQIRAVMEKQQRAALTRKAFSVGNKTFYVQGFEDLVLSWLVHEKKISPDRIKVAAKEGVPTVWYKQPSSGWENKQNGNSKRAYFPDIMVTGKTKDTLLEVKSPYTLTNGEPKVTLGNYAKFKAAWEQGFELWLVVVKSRKHKQPCIVKNPGALTRAQLTKRVHDVLATP